MAYESPSEFSREMQKARAGEKSALNWLLTNARSYLRLVAGRRAPIDASDRVQEAMLAAAGAFGGFRGATIGEWKSWLKKILNRKIARWLQRPSREIDDRALRNGHSTCAFEPADNRTPVSEKVERQEDAKWLIRAIAQLDEEDQRLVQARYLKIAPKEATSDDLACVFGDTPANIRQRLKKLRNILKQGMAMLQTLEAHPLPEPQMRLLCGRLFRGWTVKQVAEEFRVNEKLATILIGEADRALRAAREHRP